MPFTWTPTTMFFWGSSKMKIKCLHGYFKIEEQKAGEVSDFSSLFGLELEPVDNYFTFAPLADAPDFSLAGKTYLGAATTKTFAGPPWEVMRENSLVYNFNTGLVVPIAQITQAIQISLAGTYWVSPGLILPGSLTDEGKRVTDYAAWFSKDTMKWRYSAVTFD